MNYYCIGCNKKSRMNNETIIITDSTILLDNFSGQIVMIESGVIYNSLPCYLCVRNKYEIFHCFQWSRFY